MLNPNDSQQEPRMQRTGTGPHHPHVTQAVSDLRHHLTRGWAPSC